MLLGSMNVYCSLSIAVQ